jgi:proteasome lid subunit RPN8/RPN11
MNDSGAGQSGNEFIPLGRIPTPQDQSIPAKVQSGVRVFGGRKGFEAHIPIAVLQRLILDARRLLPNEALWRVATQVQDDRGYTRVFVLGVVRDADADAGPHAVNASPESAVATKAILHRVYPDGIDGGWAHSHTGIGAFFSAIDRVNQRQWTQPHSLGIVVDPIGVPTVAVFRGPDSEQLREFQSGVHAEPSEAFCEEVAGPTRNKDVVSATIADVIAPTGRYGWAVTAFATVAIVLLFLFKEVTHIHSDIELLKTIGWEKAPSASIKTRAVVASEIAQDAGICSIDEGRDAGTITR